MTKQKGCSTPEEEIVKVDRDLEVILKMGTPVLYREPMAPGGDRLAFVVGKREGKNLDLVVWNEDNSPNGSRRNNIPYSEEAKPGTWRFPDPL